MIYPSELAWAQDRKATLERRQVILYRGMQANNQRDERGLPSDKWDRLAGFYDLCSDKIAECDKIIEQWDEEHPGTDDPGADLRWYHARVL